MQGHSQNKNCKYLNKTTNTNRNYKSHTKRNVTLIVRLQHNEQIH